MGVSNTKELTTAACVGQVTELEMEDEVMYDHEVLFDTLSNPALDDASAYDVGQAYSRMGTLGRVEMARQEVARERERLMALMMGAIIQDERLQAAKRALDALRALHGRGSSDKYSTLLFRRS